MKQKKQKEVGFLCKCGVRYGFGAADPGILAQYAGKRAGKGFEKRVILSRQTGK